MFDQNAIIQYKVPGRTLPGNSGGSTFSFGPMLPTRYNQIPGASVLLHLRINNIKQNNIVYNNFFFVIMLCNLIILIYINIIVLKRKFLTILNLLRAYIFIIQSSFNIR